MFIPRLTNRNGTRGFTARVALIAGLVTGLLLQLGAVHGHDHGASAEVVCEHGHDHQPLDREHGVGLHPSLDHAHAEDCALCALLAQPKIAPLVATIGCDSLWEPRSTPGLHPKDPLSQDGVRSPGARAPPLSS